MRKKGFTLIEIMIVLVIIGILMGLISAAAFKAMESAKKSKAAADIATLETALSAYETDVGDYPPGDGSGNNSFKSYLEDGGGSPWNGPYMHFKSEDLSGNNFLDPWDVAYNYKSPGVHNANYVDIWSNGPDKTSGTSDDITNW